MNWKVLFPTFLNFQLWIGVDLAGTSALACGIWWLPSMDRRLHSPSRPGALLHRESVETLLCDSQHPQLVRATAFERRRCFAFCFLALIILDMCSLHVFANGGNHATFAICVVSKTWRQCAGSWGIALLHEVNTAIKKTKNIRYRLLCINPVLLYLRVVPFPEGIRRIRQTVSNWSDMSRIPRVSDPRLMWSCMQFSIAPSRWLRSGWPTHLGVESVDYGKNTALPSDCSLPLVWFNGLCSWFCAASVPTNFQAMIWWLWRIAFLKMHKTFATLATQRSRCMSRQLFPSRCTAAVMWKSWLISWWRARNFHRWRPKPVTSWSVTSFQDRSPNSLQMSRLPGVWKPSCASWKRTCPARKSRNRLCGAWRTWRWIDQKTKRDSWNGKVLLRPFWGPWESTAAMKPCKKKVAWRWRNWPRNTRTSWGFWVLKQIRSFWSPCKTTQPASVCKGGPFRPWETWPRAVREEPSCMNPWQLTSWTLPWAAATRRFRRGANCFVKSWRRATQGHETFALLFRICYDVPREARIGQVRWFIFFRFCGWPRKPCRQKLVLDGTKGYERSMICSRCSICPSMDWQVSWSSQCKANPGKCELRN